MNQTLANLAVIAATMGTTTFLVPQIVKLVRTGDTAGVSIVWAAIGLVTNIGWFLYMISQEHWLALFAPFITVVSYTVVLWALSRSGGVLWSAAIRGMLWSLLLASTALPGGWSALGVLLGFSHGVQMAPSVWTAYRTANPSGVSPGTWWIGLVEALLWGSFGLFNTDVGIITFAVVGVTGAGLMLGRYYATRPVAEAMA